MLQLIKTMLLSLHPQDVWEIEADPVMWDTFINGNTACIASGFDTLYSCHRDVVQRTPLLRDPAFLVQLDELLTKQYGQQAPNIWTLANVQKHSLINGSLRPMKEWRK